MAVDQLRLDRSFRLGAAIGVVVFAVILSGARPTLLSWTTSADFYDAQAESFLDGRLDIDPERLGIEAFFHDGRAYMYQPPWPALLRLPVTAVTERFEGRLAAISMVLALLVGLSATRRILGHARRAMRPDEPVARFETAAWFATGLVFAGGSVPLFLASRPWVYHESALWGLSWTLAAFAGLLRHRHDPSWRSLALVAGATFGAVGSRASVGAGACAAVGLTMLHEAWRRRHEPRRALVLGPSGVLALGLVAALPALAYAGLNVAKFGSVASIPFEEQVFTKLSEERQEMLEANDGTLFGLQFAPATTFRYLRPDGVRFSRLFPFVDYPAAEQPVVDGVQFDLIDRTPSVPASLPALAVPSVIGIIALARRRPQDPMVWLAIAAGASVGCLTIIPFGYIAHRYLADTMPLLVVLTAIGLHAAARAFEPRPAGAANGVRRATDRGIAPVAWLAMGVLVVTTVWVNVGLATLYQRLHAPGAPPDLVAGLVDARTHLGGPQDVVRGSELPPTGDEDQLAVIGDCAALFVWDGNLPGEFRSDNWIAVERTEAAGHIERSVDLDDLTPGVRHALVVAPRAGPTVAWIERGAHGHVTAGIEHLAPGTEELSTVGTPVRLSGRVALDVVLDPYSGVAHIDVDGRRRIAFALFPRGSDVTDLRVGTAAGLAGYAGIEIDDGRAPGDRGDDGSLCRRVDGG